jgi:hypothetical protein
MRALVGVATAITIGLPAGTGIAAADPLDVECTGTQTTTYSPGLTLVPTDQTVNTHTIYGPCVSASTPDLSAGDRSITNHQMASCLDLPGSRSAVTTITWNTGQQSAFSFNRTVTHAGGNTIVIFTGTIVAGLFAGDSALEVVVGPTLSTLDCLTPPGITSRTGVVTLTITST